MDERGLLHAGDGLTALTWMDATVGGVPVTPRHGYPVEINALWYNALSFTRALRSDSPTRNGPSARSLPASARLVSGNLLDSRRRLSGRRFPRRHPRYRRPAESALRRLAPLLAPRPLGAGGRRPEGPGGAPHPLRPSDPLARRSGLPGPLPGQRRRAGLRVPSGHRLALAARPLRRGRPQGRRGTAKAKRKNLRRHLRTFLRNHLSRRASAASPRSSTGTPPTGRAGASPRPGASPS